MSKTIAYREGRRAYYAGQDETDNPYVSPPQSAEWRKGFTDAVELCKQNEESAE